MAHKLHTMTLKTQAINCESTRKRDQQIEASHTTRPLRTWWMLWKWSEGGALSISSDVEVQDLKNKQTEAQEMAVAMVHLCGLFGWIKKHIEH